MSSFRLLRDGEPPILALGETALDPRIGTFIHRSLSGQLSLMVVAHGNVTVAERTAVATHSVSLAGEGTTERMNFRRGGHVEIDRDASGRAVEVRGHEVRFESYGHDLVVHPLPSSQP